MIYHIIKFDLFQSFFIKKNDKVLVKKITGVPESKIIKIKALQKFFKRLDTNFKPQIQSPIIIAKDNEGRLFVYPVFNFDNKFVSIECFTTNRLSQVSLDDPLSSVFFKCYFDDTGFKSMDEAVQLLKDKYYPKAAFLDRVPF